MGIFQLEDFVAGWIGGAASVIVGYPLDTVKTRLQAGVGYGNTLNCIRVVYKRESVFGFFKGMSFPLASIAVYNSVVFGVFSNTQRFLSRHRCGEPEDGPGRSLSDLLLASMMAGMISVGLGGPVDLIKIRLQMQTQPFQEASHGLKSRAVALGEQAPYQGPVHCISTIVRTEGLAGLYRGASAMLLRDIPGYCLYFTPYVFLSEWITPEACTGPSPFAVWLAGGIAGAVSWATATPMDVVKSRMQADGVYLNKYKGVLDCITQSYQQEGLKENIETAESRARISAVTIRSSRGLRPEPTLHRAAAFLPNLPHVVTKWLPSQTKTSDPRVTGQLSELSYYATLGHPEDWLFKETRGSL